jgi:hypothetical protein
MKSCLPSSLRLTVFVSKRVNFLVVLAVAYAQVADNVVVWPLRWVWRKSYDVTKGRLLSWRIKPNALRYTCNRPAWHFAIWILILSFTLKMEVACSFKISVCIFQTKEARAHQWLSSQWWWWWWFSRLRDVICEGKTVIFCALAISNFVTRSFNFCTEEISNLCSVSKLGNKRHSVVHDCLLNTCTTIFLIWSSCPYRATGGPEVLKSTTHWL